MDPKALMECLAISESCLMQPCTDSPGQHSCLRASHPPFPSMPSPLWEPLDLSPQQVSDHRNQSFF